jgi:hypothetical protein
MSHDAYHPEIKSERSKPDPAYVADLIGVLIAQPGGLRRWSVMRAIRQRLEKAQRPVPHKFEDKVERAFRGFCADDPLKSGESQDALFYRPKDKAGEVWAVHAERARAWLNTEFSGSMSAHV